MGEPDQDDSPRQPRRIDTCEQLLGGKNRRVFVAVDPGRQRQHGSRGRAVEHRDRDNRRRVVPSHRNRDVEVHALPGLRFAAGEDEGLPVLPFRERARGRYSTRIDRITARNSADTEDRQTRRIMQTLCNASSP